MSLPVSSRSRIGRSWAVPRPFLTMVTDCRRSAVWSPGVAAAPEVSATLARAARAAARAGIDAVQVRERGLEDASLLALVLDVRAAIANTGARLLVNDRLDIALAAGADGVHLPATAVSCARLRAIVPADFLVGRSIHSAAEAVTAERDGGCDYLIFGTVFESESKPAGHSVAGLAALADVCAAVRLPVLAIGGITLARLPDVVRAGAAGIAAIGLFAGGGEEELRKAVTEIRLAFASHSSASL